MMLVVAAFLAPAAAEEQRPADSWLQYWTIADCAARLPDGNQSGYYLRPPSGPLSCPAAVREGLLILCPKEPNVPVKLTRTIKTLAAGSSLRMALASCRHEQGRWTVSIKVNGSVLAEPKTITNSQLWQEFRYDLSQYANQTVQIQIEAASADPNTGCAFFDYVQLEPTQPSGGPAGPHIRSARPFFGVRVTKGVHLGLKVTEVAPNSPAEAAGIHVGDIIYEFADRKFYTRTAEPQNLYDAVWLAPADKPVKVVFLHDGKKILRQLSLPVKPLLGVMYSGHEGKGFLVRAVLPNTPASEAGISQGDLIVAYADKIFNETHLASAILEQLVTSSRFDIPVKITLLRNGRELQRYVIYKHPGSYKRSGSHQRPGSHKRPSPAEPAGRSTKEEATKPQAPPPQALTQAPEPNHFKACEVIFNDNFDQENQGRAQLNYRGFKNWLVTRGEVDLIGNGFLDYKPGNGLYVELDGSQSSWSKVPVAGTLRTKQPLQLAAGTYLLQFDLAGHPTQGPNSVTVRLQGLFSETFTLPKQPSEIPFKTIRRVISVTQRTTTYLSFEHHGGDYAGLLLDNISLAKAQLK